MPPATAFLLLAGATTMLVGWVTVPATLRLRLEASRAHAACAIALGLGIAGTVGAVALCLIDEADYRTVGTTIVLGGLPVQAALLIARGAFAWPAAPRAEARIPMFRLASHLIAIALAAATATLGNLMPDIQPDEVSRWTPRTLVDWTPRLFSALSGAGALALGYGIGLLPQLVTTTDGLRGLFRVTIGIIVLCTSAIAFPLTARQGLPPLPFAYNVLAGPTIAGIMAAVCCSTTQ